MDKPTSKVGPMPSTKGRPPSKVTHIPTSLHRRVTTSIRPSPSSTGTHSASEPQNPTLLRLRTATIDESSNENEPRMWFVQSNTNPQIDFSHSLQDEPPYFLSQGSFNGSNHSSWRKKGVQHPPNKPAGRPGMGRSNTETTNSTDEYRGVIDDLTVENRRLREENKRLKKSHTPHLAKERLFEITIHELSARKRRQLENKLLEFAASLDESSSSDNAEASSTGASQNHLNGKLGQRLQVRSSASTSQPVDSAYNSVSNYGQNPSPNLIIASSLQGGASNQTRQGNTNTTHHHSLQGIPEDTLPKNSTVLTERQKKMLVVQRLEQLFSGKRATEVGSHSQHLQQREGSKLAARADHTATNTLPRVVGAREALMLLTPMEADLNPSRLIGSGSSYDTQLSVSTCASNCSKNSPGQRPTHPLDLDPDRAQEPSDNIEYIRHLGLSTPQLIGEDSSDVEQDAHGWIYLNLLINMAQLHTINVTPDFVRQAVQDISERFQISQDGNKLRWRGCLQDTHLSNDSGLGSPRKQAPDDSDEVFGSEIGGSGGKRRKIDVTRFASIPVDAKATHTPSGNSGVRGDLHYKPLFNHTSSASDGYRTSAGSSVASGYKGVFTGSRETRSRSQRTLSRASRSGTQSKRRRDDGTMVFYSNAHFYTDLSRDREGSPPPRVSGEGDYGFHSYTGDALGCKPRLLAPPISRTASGSTLPFRPFKAHVVAETEESGSSSPELSVLGSAADDRLINSFSNRPNLNASLQSLEVCGLGGIQPTDHFIIQVDTRRADTASKVFAKGHRHNIFKSSLDTFTGPGLHSNEDNPTEEPASPVTFGSPPTMSHSIQQPELLIKIEYLSERFTQLEPSKLPEAIGYYGSSTTSDNNSECSQSSEDASPVKRRLLLDQSFTASNNLDTLKWTMQMGDVVQTATIPEDREDDKEDEQGQEEEESDRDADDSDSSIDMLAHMREIDPEAVALREREFEMAAAADAHMLL